jgi:hypothetical protein
MFVVSVVCCRGLCDELITRPEESYRLWCVIVCDLETSTMRRPWPALGRSTTAKKNLWPDDGLVIEAETCCHLVTLTFWRRSFTFKF